MKFKRLLLFRKLLMYSINFLLVQLIFCGVLLAAEKTHAQRIQSVKDIVLSIDFENDNLVSAFEKIESKTDVVFDYNKSHVTNNTKLTRNYKNETLYNVLIEISEKSSLLFKQINNTINVRKPKSSKLPEQEQLKVIVPRDIKGQVIGESGEPLIGATVKVKGTSIGSVTDETGAFAFSVSDDADILLITYIGYEPLEIAIGDKDNFDIKMQPAETTLDNVVVVGYRQSLEDAIAIKKENTNSIDAIVAEDIAKFPQSNMAEALQRVSGIQIRRDDAGGVGNEVSVRGLPSEYTQVTVDGDAVPNDADGRNFNFNTLPAEIFNKVEVKKSPTAKDTEGGIGGSVNLVTRKPFELDNRVLVATAEGVYNTQQQQGNNITPKLSLAYGDRWEKFGLIAGVFYNKFFNTSEGYDVTRYYNQSYDLDGDGINDFENIRVPRPRYVSQGQQVERLSFNLSLQYQVSENFNLVFSGLYIKNNQTVTRYTPIWFLPGDNPTSIVADGQLVKSITYGEVLSKLENQRQTNENTNTKFSIAGKWNIGNGWKLGSKIIHAYNKRDSERFRYYADNRNTATYSVENDLQFFELETPTDFSNANDFFMSQARRYLWNYGDEIFTGKLDISKKLNERINFEFGGSFRDRTKIREYFFRRENLNAPFHPVAALLTGFMNNIDDAPGFNQFLIHDWDKSHELYGSQLDLTDFKVIDATYDINERISAGYAQSNIELSNLDINAGLRVVHTGITSKGFELDDATQIFETRNVKSDYIDFLPSVNLKFEPIKNLIARGSFSRVITRPSLQDLSSFRLIDEINRRITAKNPELDPFRANQYEFSIEWYPTSETLISGAVFVKDIESFISQQTSLINFNGEQYEIRQPVNGNDAVIKGLELNYQQPFTFLPGILSGFGIAANYTMSVSDFKERLTDGSVETYSLPNNSKHSYNIIAYYEKYGFSLRVAQNYRSDFLREIPNPEDGLKFRDDVRITDISSSYNINDKISVTLNILNAFNAKKFEYIFDRNYMDNVSFFGRTFQLGVRAKL